MMYAMMYRNKMHQHGFSLMELMIVLLVASAVAAGMTAVFISGNHLISEQTDDFDFQREAARALDTIQSDLRQTGRVDLGGGAVYPYLYTNGVAAGYFAPYSHAPAKIHVPPADQAYGQSREIIFKVPADLDGDGKYTNAVTGAIEWSTQDYGYRLVTGADGINQLQRQVNGVLNSVVAYGVERVVFQDQTGDPALGPNQIRVTLYMAKPDPVVLGDYITETYSSVVNMRNVAGEGNLS